MRVSLTALSHRFVLFLWLLLRVSLLAAIRIFLRATFPPPLAHPFAISVFLWDVPQVKTTIMQEWDGLRTTKDRVVVIGGTNR